MKIRNGFVSNSSSSSFLAIGFSVKDVESVGKLFLLEVGEMTTEEYSSKVAEQQEKYNFEYKDACNEIFWDSCYSIAKEKGVRFLNGNEDGVDRDDKVIAVILTETDSDGGCFYESGEISFDEDNEYFVKAKNLRDKINPDANIKVIYGTRCC